MVVFFQSNTGVGTHGAVDVSSLSIRDISDHIFRAWLEFNLVKQNEFGIDVVSDVPNSEQEFSVDFTVLVAGHVDWRKDIDFVLKRDGAVGNIKQRLLRCWVDWRHKRERYVSRIGDVHGQRDVGDITVDKGGFVVVVPSIAIHVATVVVITRGHGAIGEVAFIIGGDHDSEFLAKFEIDKFNGLVGHDIAVHVCQGVLEDGARHGHGKVVGWFNSDFNRVGEKDFLSVVELSDHVVGTREQTGLVERAGFNHGSREGTNTDEQARSVERSCSFKHACTLNGLTLTGISITVGSAERRGAF